MIKISYIAKLDEKTSSNLEDIYNSSYQKYRKGLMKKKPSKLEIVRTLINGLHELMVEDGEING